VSNRLDPVSSRGDGVAGETARARLDGGMARPERDAEPGVVKCAAYAEGAPVGEVSVDAISEVLKVPGHFVWIGLHEPSAELLRRVQQEFGLHDLAVEDALRAHQRPKVEEYGDGLFVVLRTAQRRDGTLAMGETHVFIGANYVVTVRHGASLPYTPVRARCEASRHLLRRGPAFVLYAVMDFVVDQFFPIVDAYEDELEALEEQIFGDGFDRSTTERIYGRSAIWSR